MGTPGSPAEVKALLKTMEGVNWRMAKEERPAKGHNTTSARPRASPEPTLL